jgi:hypothetical protein
VLSNCLPCVRMISPEKVEIYQAENYSQFSSYAVRFPNASNKGLRLWCTFRKKGSPLGAPFFWLHRSFKEGLLMKVVSPGLLDAG